MMERILAKTTHQTQPIWQKSNWYHAITLTERIASLQAYATFPQTMCGTEKAQRRLQQWKEQAPFHTGSFFAERLAMDSLTEDDLLALLAEPIEAVQARIGTSPEWLMELRQAFEDYDPTGDRSLPVRNAEDSRHLLSFLNVIKPLLLPGVDRLDTGIQHLAQKYTYIPFDSQAIVPSLFAFLASQILSKLSRTLVLELNVARLQGRLQGTTPQERFEDFVRQLCQGEMLALLEEYAVLARQLVEIIDQWVAYSLEFLRHLCADWEQICEIFAPQGDPDMLMEVKGGVGDTHRSGRSVMLLRFRSGLQLVYKPKSLAIDVHFQELLDWVNERGQQPAFRTLKLINKGSYGWSESISACDCTSVAEVERFYERQGAYLALLYALQATDFHCENIIAAGEYPMLIDLEALFHPEVRKDDQAIFANPAYEALVHSVLRISLLPHRLWFNDDAEGEGIDISGLGGQEGQLSPRPVSRWEETGTDRMRVVRRRVEIPAANNRPRLNGLDVDTLSYRDSLISGFSRMYQLLREHRDELVAEQLPRFAHDEIRFIARATNIYALLLADSFHPNVLRDALKRDRLFDRLWVGIERRPYLSRIIAVERADLLRGDIPLFTTRPSSRDLYTSQGEQVAEFFNEPSIESVRKHIQRLDEQDLARQIWLVQASFTSMSMGMEQVTRKVRQLQPAHTRVTRERLVAAASAVGEHLCNLALRNEDAAGWLGVAPVNEREWQLQPTDTSLYHGTSGIALFLAYLAACTGETGYLELAEAALKTVCSLLEVQKKYRDVDGIGAFEGLGAPIYLFSHLGALWHKPTLFHEAEALVELLADLIEKDDHLDIIAGSAGCIASLLSLYTVAPTAQTLAAAVQCGDHLLARARPMQIGVGWSLLSRETPLAGFSHGAAGIAWSLLSLAEVSGEEHFRQTALAALAYERNLFSPRKQNWLDLRGRSVSVRSNQAMTEENDQCMTAWCHGAPGIGLSRLAALQYVDDATIRQEIDIALKTTLAEGFGRNHSLCHGDFGNLETLLMATSILDEPRYREQLERITAMLLESIDSSGWITGVPLGVETPGLMTGLAGIGYELLRLAAPEQVPSVLLLAPPNSASPNRARK